MSETAEIVSKAIRFQLASQHKTVEGLAKLLGRDRMYVSRRLNGGYSWGLDELDTIAEYFGMKSGFVFLRFAGDLENFNRKAVKDSRMETVA